MSGAHIPTEVRRDVVGTIESLHRRTQISVHQLLGWADLHTSRYHRWRGESKPTPEPKQRRQCSWETLPEEREAIIAYREALERSGRTVSYRIQTYEMLDNDIVACSESTVFRVLSDAGKIAPSVTTQSKKGNGFTQPRVLHAHWHIDISYLWEFGHRAYLISVLEGMSRAVLHHKVMRSMTTGDVELVLQHAREKYPCARPRLITDNGGQFVNIQFKGFLADCGYSHVRTSVKYPQSNGKMERQFRTTKEELRRRSIIDFEDLEAQIDETIHYYNYTRYHSAIGYVTPMDVLEARAELIQLQRRMKLDDARLKRKVVHSQSFN